MMLSRIARGGRPVAPLLVWLLLVAGFATGLAAGLHADVARAGLAVVCAEGQVSHGTGDGGHTPACCALGCLAAFTALPSPPDPAAAAATGAAPAEATAVTAAAPRLPRTPQQARAPPAA